MSRMVAWPVPSNVTSCRPPVAVASSEKVTEPPGRALVTSTCTDPPERKEARAALKRLDADIAAGAGDGVAETVGADREAGAVADGSAVLLAVEPQPASVPRPSKADSVSVIALPRVGRIVLITE
jgi:hypothetical protein